MNKNISSIKLTSPAFKNGENIPKKYTCDGENANPLLNISGVPEAAKSLVLIVDDPDAPGGTWVHWVVWNIKPALKEIPEKAEAIGVQGAGSGNKNGYSGPCPPNGTHRYFFKLFALDDILNIPTKTTANNLKKAMEGHIIDYSEIIGLYSRN